MTDWLLVFIIYVNVLWILFFAHAFADFGFKHRKWHSFASLNIFHPLIDLWRPHAKWIIACNSFWDPEGKYVWGSFVHPKFWKNLAPDQALHYFSCLIAGLIYTIPIYWLMR